MKTTVDIPDALLEEAKSVADRDRTTLRELIESGLRHSVKERSRLRAKRFKLRRVTFAGNGLQREVSDGAWDHLRDLSYEGRGS